MHWFLDVGIILIAIVMILRAIIELVEMPAHWQAMRARAYRGATTFCAGVVTAALGGIGIALLMGLFTFWEPKGGLPTLILMGFGGALATGAVISFIGYRRLHRNVLDPATRQYLAEFAK